jgi:transketolase
MSAPGPRGLDIATLERLSAQARRHVLESVHTAGAGHIGGPLSAADILVHLYFNELNIDPANPRWEDRDRFILSKGHSSIGLYSVMAMRGYFPLSQLATFDAVDSLLQGHPCMKTLPGIDMSTGSLGQGLSPGLGMALAARKLDKTFHTWVMLGDGEIQEGQIWEACFVAGRYDVDNLTAVLDYNGLPQFGWPDPNGYTREEKYDRPAEKFRAFGWHAVECDGHDHASIAAAFAAAKSTKGRPTCIIAHTIKGKGVSFMEGDFNWHAKSPTTDELAAAIDELTCDEDVEKAA